MITLARFVGELIKDIADARTYADYHAATTSELYHADPFVKNLPIPHYIIEEAEIEVPVIVVGVSKDSDQFILQKEKMIEIIKNQLPLTLLRSYKWNYVAERQAIKQQKEKEKESEKLLQEELSSKRKNSFDSNKDDAKENIPQELLEMFDKSIKQITQKMIKHFGQYVYNYEILKLLEITEDFSKALMKFIIDDMKNYDKENLPYLSDENINKSANYIGNIFFFEFKQIMQTDTGVNIEPATGLMNEYASKDNIMHIKIKIREQDLNLNVEDNKGKEKRYLSLT